MTVLLINTKWYKIQYKKLSFHTVKAQHSVLQSNGAIFNDLE